MRMDMDPKLWGPPGWEFLDAIVEGYPVTADLKQRRQMIAFLNSLEDLLPCTVCRENYKAFIVQHNPQQYVDSKKLVREWLDEYKKKSSPINRHLEDILSDVDMDLTYS